MVKIMGGVLMKTRTKISYVILKYDDQTDNIFTKTTNNDNHFFELPTFEYVQKRDSNLLDVKQYVLSKVVDFNTFIDSKHIFVPFVSMTINGDERTYNYTAIIFESNKNAFSSMNYETWHRVKYDKRTHMWELPWGSGLSDRVDFKIRDISENNYAPNPENNPKITFSNVMHFVDTETSKFPILGLMSGEKFTMKQVLHYQELLGMDTLEAGNNETFENQYSDSIQAINDNRITTSYIIKNEYLQK